MPAKVVDASVIAAWCFREPRAAEALAILKDSELHAPLLLAYELTSIARRKSVAYPEKTKALADGLELALAIPIHWSEVEHPAVLRLALDTNLTAYDACYLYLARRLGLTLATFDERLARASRTS
ncbi:MAG: type II toxin-antitoxin system VapC family toxin [Chloroflexi bacterium]|nr:type II toxin-antitoxin system VapC family toxin [Chloroflexota bacterium]